MKPTQVLMSKIIPHEISMKKRRRKLNIKNFPNQSRKLKSKNQAQVKMKVVMMKKGEDDDQASCISSDDSEEIKQLVRGVNKLLKKLNSKGVPTTMEQLISYNQRKKNKKRNILVVVRRDTTLNIVLT